MNDHSQDDMGRELPGHGSGADKAPARCQEVASALTAALALDEVAERHLAHAEGCEECGEVLERQRSMAVVVARTRRALERARPDLPPERWVEMRAAVDAAARRRSAWRFGLVGLALAAAAGLLVVVAPAETGGVDTPSLAEGRALRGVGSSLPAVRPALREEPAREGGAALVVAEGTRLEAGPAPRVIEAFGRHRLELAPGAIVRVERFEPTGIELALEAGTATFEVERRTDEELFRVWSGDVQVVVRGTVFTVERLAAGETRVSVERGKVSVERVGTEPVAVAAGERVTFPSAEPSGATAPIDAAIEGVAGVEPGREAGVRASTSHVGASGSVGKGRPAPRPERVVEIDVGATSMTPPSGALQVDDLIPPILGAVRTGRCVQALSALDELSRSVGSAMPRAGLWLTAYCQRKLGNLDASRAMFRRYGPSGPWSVPSGDELPPLP